MTKTNFIPASILIIGSGSLYSIHQKLFKKRTNHILFAHLPHMVFAAVLALGKIFRPCRCLLAFAIFTSLSAPTALAQEALMTDYAAAKAEAAKTGKDIFLAFTGSDWSESCGKLIKESLSQKDFRAAVGEHFVLLQLDFPEKENPLINPKVKAQNKEISEEYAVNGYPTIYLCDAKGLPYAQTGYIVDSDEPYQTHVNDLRTIRDVRDKAFKTLIETDSPAKAKSLISALEAMELDSELISRFYGDVLDQIKKSDPTDTHGYLRKISGQYEMSQFNKKINSYTDVGGENAEKILAIVDKALANKDLTAEQKQDILITRILVFYHQGHFNEAIKVLEETLVLSPESEPARYLQKIKTEILKERDAHDKKKSEKSGGN
ncbi:MAG: thioredoxin family protein [Verrucomicrobiota bacterium]